MHHDFETNPATRTRSRGLGGRNSGKTGWPGKDLIEKEFQFENFDAVQFTTPHDLY